MKCRNCKNLGKLVDENGEPYDWCEKVCDNTDIHAERNCKHYVVASNADRIRAMSDDEMAAKIVSFRCPLEWCFPEGGENCKRCWLDWLRQEAGE